nr:DUF1800 family protein [uncultured Undibacterium sp.]
MTISLRLLIACSTASMLMLTTSCSRNDDAITPPNNSTGQVATQTNEAVTLYAAARFADQVSFGGTPALLTEIQSKGFAQWIDDQFVLPVSKVDPSPYAVYDPVFDKALDQSAWPYSQNQYLSAMIGSQDQLRRRVSWALSQFVTVSGAKILPYGGMQYSNFLQVQAFGNYGTFLRDLSTNPGMGVMLDNNINRPKSNFCLGCAPNENFARELLQLFSIGLVKLNADGSVERDANGKAIESYTQSDVSHLAGALTGWNTAPRKANDWTFHDEAMRMETWNGAHDLSEKKILGVTFAAGKAADAELDQVITVLMQHPNIAPFISLRLIQHLVTSNPSPEYIGRISAVFRNNGKGVAGDMKAIIKAILLDPEARAGDKPASLQNGFGKIREPILFYTALLRGLGCTKALYPTANYVIKPEIQIPYQADSVFSYYQPNDRAPESNLLAPEQRLLTAPELSARFYAYGVGDNVNAIAGGCNLSPFAQAFLTPENFAELVNQRYLRGAMPPQLRQSIIDMAPTIWGSDTNQKAMNLLAFALATSPNFGVIQ